MSRVTLRAYNPVEVELYDHIFESVDLPEGKAKEMIKVSTALENAESDDESLPHLWEWFDLVLSPLDGGKSKPSTVLKAKYKAQDLTPRQIVGLWVDLNYQISEANKGPENEVAENGRPT